MDRLNFSGGSGKTRDSSEKRNSLGKKLTFLALPVQIADKSR